MNYIALERSAGLYSISGENFRAALQLENKYLGTKDLLKYESGRRKKNWLKLELFFYVFNPVKTGTKITRLNFIIKHRKSVQEKDINELN